MFGRPVETRSCRVLNHTPNHNSPPDLHRDRSDQTTPLPQQLAPDEAAKRNFDGIHNVNPCVTPRRTSIDSVDRSVAIRFGPILRESQ